MGKAHQAPKATYQRTFIVSHHALQRYRERVEHEHMSRSDFDLGNLLDERIKTAERHQTIVDTREVDAVTRVFEVEHRDGAIYYAVVRDQTVVTVLDREMLEVNFANGSWKRGPMNTPFASLTLRGVVPETPASKDDEHDVLKRSLVAERRGPPPGVPSLPGPLVVEVARVEPDPVAAASMRLGQAMLARTRAAQLLVKLREQHTAAAEALSASEEEVKVAQQQLTDAVEKAAQEGK